MPCRSSGASHSRSICSRVSSCGPPEHNRTHLRWDDRLEDDVQTVLGLDEANIFDNIIVVEVLEEVDLGLYRSISSAVRTGCFWCLCRAVEGGPDRRMGIDLDHAELALGEVGELDLLDGNRLARAPIECLVDGAERSLADAVAESLSYRRSQT